jgi:hypothetical protein
MPWYMLARIIPTATKAMPALPGLNNYNEI